MFNLFNKKELRIGSIVKYEGKEFIVQWLDENNDNLYLFDGEDGHSSVSKLDIKIVRS